jgi:hypothetical protein
MGKQANPLNPIPAPETPWEDISWDLIGLLPETVADISSKGLKLEPATVCLSTGAMRIMRDQVYCKEGLLKRSIVTEALSLWGLS